LLDEKRECEDCSNYKKAICLVERFFEEHKEIFEKLEIYTPKELFNRIMCIKPGDFTAGPYCLNCKKERKIE